jgi:hypothetical protein
MGILSNHIHKEVPEKFKDLIDLYSEMVRTRRKIDLGVGDLTHERLRHDKLACKVDPLWSELSNVEQRMAVKELVNSGWMPEVYAKALLILDARIDMMPPPEPCLTIGPKK